MTVVTGIEAEHERLQALAKTLKSRCGAGGTIRDGAIEIQGDHVETILGILTAEGYRPKRSGG